MAVSKPKVTVYLVMHLVSCIKLCPIVTLQFSKKKKKISLSNLVPCEYAANSHDCYSFIVTYSEKNFGS